MGCVPSGPQLIGFDTVEFERPWLVAVQPEGSALTGAFWIELEPPQFGTQNHLLRVGVVRDRLDLAVSLGGGGRYVGYDIETLGLIFDQQAEGAYIIGGLPPEASIVTATLADGTRLWQRPIAGLALFESPSSADFTVLDENGFEIFSSGCSVDDYC